MTGHEIAVILRSGAQGTPRGSTVALHHHPDPELGLVAQGSARYLISGRFYGLEPWSLVWLPAGQPHVLLDVSPDHRMWIVAFRASFVRAHADPAFVHTLLGAPGSEARVRRISLLQGRALARLADELDRRRVPAPLAQAAGAAILQLAGLACAMSSQTNLGTDMHPGVERALQLLVQKRPPQSLRDLAAAVYLSPSALSRLFKAQTGVSLPAFRHRMKMESFLRIYGHGQHRNLQEAAYAAGFGSYAQFFRVFVRTMGSTPAQYRRGLSRTPKTET